jgi:hypothetical protein
MRSALFIVALTAALAFVGAAQGQSLLKDGSANRELSDRVMALVAKGDMEAGIRLAKPYLAIPESEVEAMIVQAKLQAPMLEMRFGKPVGVEFIREERAGEHVMRIVQICRHEKHLTRWSFYFYRTPTGWVLNTLNFDDKLQALF